MKSIKLDAVKASANAIFRESADNITTERRAIHYFVADLLMKANAYKGFRYLEATDLEPGKSIGLIRATEPDGKHIFPDETRIAFL